jgi:hypothetical protein
MQYSHCLRYKCQILYSRLRSVISTTSSHPCYWLPKFYRWPACRGATVAGVTVFYTYFVISWLNHGLNIFVWRCGTTGCMVFSFLSFIDRTQRRATFGRTPAHEWTARRRNLCLTQYNTQKRQTSMPPAVFEPTISSGERSQTYALDRAATVTD